MNYWIVGLVCLTAWLSTLLVFYKLWRLSQQSSQNLIQQLTKANQELLNRAMTKEWESFVQVNQASSLLTSPSVTRRTDADELEAFGHSFDSYGEEMSLGDELTELGIGFVDPTEDLGI